MRKLSILMLALLILALGVFPVAATPIAELTDLARYYPVNTPLFASMRMDAEFIATVDGLAQGVDAKLGGMLGGMTLRDGLDRVAQEIDPEGDFESTFGWAGDTVAIGVTSYQMKSASNTDEPVIIAIAVADVRQAELFLDNLKPDGYVKEDSNAGGTLYRPRQASPDAPVFYLADDALLIRPTTTDPNAIVPGFDASLADNKLFQEAMSRLALDDYNAVAYVDSALLLAALEQSDAKLELIPMNMDIVAMLEAIGPQSAGFTILDGRNLVIDIAVHVQDRGAYEAAGGKLQTHEPIQLDFASKLPASTALSVQSTGFGPQLIESLAELKIMGDFYDEQYEQGNLSYEQENLRQLDESATFIRQAFEGLTNLTMQEAFGSLTGDFIAYLNILPNDNPDLPVLPDFGVLVDTSNRDASALISAMPNLLYDLGIDYEEEDGMLVIPLLGDMIGNNALDLLFGEQDGFLVSGTRSGIAAMGQDSLADTESFQYASQFFVEDAQALAYINVAPLRELISMMAQMGVSDTQELALILPLFESASMTANYDESGNGQVRLIVTLAP
jgi:hypothetical protein